MTTKLYTIIFFNFGGAVFSDNIIVSFLLQYCNDTVIFVGIHEQKSS